MDHFYPRSKKNDEKAEKIVTILKDYGSVMSSGEILELYPENVPVETLKTFLQRYVKPYYPCIKAVPRKGYLYEEPEKKPENVFKNAEGYPDSTAGKALANYMMKNDSANQIPGEIWIRDTGSYKHTQEMALVLGASKGVVNYLVVRDYDLERTYWYSGYCLLFTSTNGTNKFVDFRQIRTSGQNSFDRYDQMVDEDIFERVLEGITDRFGLDKPKEIIKEVEVPKVVYETKEVPAEITQEEAIRFLFGCGWLAEHDSDVAKEQQLKDEKESGKSFEVWKAKAEAYELALRLVCEGRG